MSTHSGTNFFRAIAKIGRKKNKLPEGTKEQGGLETFKHKASYNGLEEKFFISLTSRKTFHTARLNLSAEEFKHILDGMVISYENVVYPDNANRSDDVECDCSERDYDDPRQDLD